MDFDIIVLGGGPGGYVAAIKGAQLGKKTALIEMDTVGGVCLNRGCIPTKTLLKSAEILNMVKESNNYGIIDCSIDQAKVDMVKVQERKRAVVSQLVRGVEGLLKANGVTLIREEGRMIDKNTIKVGEKSVTAQNIIIATGSVYQEMPIDVSPEAKILSGDDILNLDYIPDNMVILGGGVIAVEFAYFLNKIGCKISIVVRSRILRTSADEEIAAAVVEHFRKSGIDVYEAADLVKVEKDSVTVKRDGNLHTIKADYILNAMGRKPSTRGVPCQELGIATDRGAIVTNERMETSVKGVYAIGDVNGKYMLAHVASMEGIVAVENICNVDSTMSYKAIPSCIYIQPEVASTGLTEKEAKEKYGDIKVGKIPMYTNGKSLVEGNTNGLIKVVVEPECKEIVGVHLYALHATDMIAEAVLAMDMEATSESAGKSVHPHPTVSEAIFEAFHAATGKAIHSL